jgi:hypothetical protein
MLKKRMTDAETKKEESVWSFGCLQQRSKILETRGNSRKVSNAQNSVVK